MGVQPPSTEPIPMQPRDVGYVLEGFNRPAFMELS